MLNTAVKAARRAGGIINRASQNLDLLHVSRKSHSDFVSEVDSNAEEEIIKVLLEAYPKVVLQVIKMSLNISGLLIHLTAPQIFFMAFLNIQFLLH